MSAPAENLPVAQNPDSLLTLAVERGADVAQLERLMDLHERWQAQKARQAYSEALARFQSECPSMERRSAIKHGDKIISKYAKIDEMKTTAQPFLEKNGLTVTFDIQDTDTTIKVGCRITHIGGHSETTWMNAAPDITGSKNEVQARGSTVTYLMRYTMAGALGITSADEDDDGGATGGPVVERMLHHQSVVRELFHSVYRIKVGIQENDLSSAAEAWQELSKEEKIDLWLAPTKGGIFTTEERKIMQTTEFREAYFGESNGEQEI